MIDESLLARARNGDAEALGVLLQTVRPEVMRRCSRVLPLHQDAEDAAQEALLTIATRLGSYDGRGSFAGWVAAVATNTARGTYRTLKRRSAELGTDQLPERPDPRTTSIVAGTRLDLLEALDRLEQDHPAAVRAFVLRDLAELTYDDVAAQLDVPIGTVKARIHTARQHVRKNLRPNGNLSAPRRI